MLSTSSISYHVGHKQILSNVSADFQPGEFNMILGPNGSGKSTFLKIFSGDLDPNEGEVNYGGRSLRSISKPQLATRRAVMSQHSELNFPLAVDEVILMGRYPHFNFIPTKKDMAICDEVMKRMDLHALKERNYLTLSGGEKQRVQFARVLAQIWESPAEGQRYLMLDEPLSSLDINYQHEFLRLAEEFIHNNTVLVAIIHDINLAIQYADKLFFLKEGRLVAEGKPSTVVTAALIETVFGIKASIVPNPISAEPLVLFEK